MTRSHPSASPVSPSDRVHEDPQLLELRRELEEIVQFLNQQDAPTSDDGNAPLSIVGRIAAEIEEWSAGAMHADKAAHEWMARAQSSEASLALAVRALEPFARAFEVAGSPETLETAIHQADTMRGWVGATDFRAARLALIQIKGEGLSSRVTDSGGQEPPSSTPSQDEGG